MKRSQIPDTVEVVMVSAATTDILPRKKGHVRLTEASTSWRFRPQPDGRVRVVDESHINPGSAPPGWVTNMLLVDTPYQMMGAFIEEAGKPKYRNAEISFVREPPASSGPAKKRNIEQQ